MRGLYYKKMHDMDNSYHTQHEAGRDLLSQALSETFCLNKSVQELEEEIAVSPQGKPYLKNHPEIFFNISHCNGFIACVVADTPIGIDIERIRTFRSSLVRRILSEEEQEYIAQFEQDSEKYQEVFFQFWTLKEAYLKWKGSGFFENPKIVTFTFTEDGSIICSDKQVLCEQKKIDDDCIMAVIK